MNREDILLMTEKLQRTGRCRHEVGQAAAVFSVFDVTEYEELLRHLVDTGEDQALGILLNVCAVNKIKLTPELLVESLGVVEPLPDFAAPFCMQDQSVIEPLLTMALASNISWQRQVFAARLATELTIRFGQDPKPVKKVLMKLSNNPFSPETGLFNGESLALLDIEDIPDDLPWLTQGDPLNKLPREKPPVVIGGSYSVRRPVPKLGRNEPCHCGSGKKYKKCCLEKDQVLIRDASPYEGLTMTELKSRPGVVDDPMLIEQMRAYDLKKLDPPNLGSRQLLAAYHRCVAFGLYDQASALIVELQGRSDFDFDPGHFQDLLESALSAKDLESAKKIRALIPDDQLDDPEELELRFALLENPSWFKALESRCRKALTGEREEWNDPLVAASHSLENIFPALSIVFSRAAILGAAGREFDQESLLDVIHGARIELDIDPWEDPVEEYLNWLLEKREADVANDLQSREIDQLRDKVSEAKQLAAQRLNELKNKEGELADLNTRLREKAKTPAPAPQPINEAIATSPHDRQMISKLRHRIEDLKLDISRGQQERRNLRRQIRQALEEADGHAQADEKNDSDSTEPSVAFEDIPKKILFPEFSNDYQNSCKTIAGSVVVKSLKAAAGFAAHDRSVWRQTKALSALSSIYSIRVGIHYRLLIRWKKDLRLEVLDLIPREQLDTWIRGFHK
jgi:hypothetical protein